MPTNIMYHLWGISGYRIVSVSSGSTWVRVELRSTKSMTACRRCGSTDLVLNGTAVRLVKSTPIGKRVVGLHTHIQRYRCNACLSSCLESVGFAEPGKSYTHALARYVVELSACMTIQDIADLTGLGWDTVKDIVKRHLKSKYSRIALGGLQRLMIDEICVGKNGRYLTIVQDADTGRVVFVGEGKDAKALDPFWARLKRSGANIEALATDMSSAYRLSVVENLPGVAHVFDHFHIVKLFNEKLSDLRRQMCWLLDPEQKKIVKGTMWLLLKNEENLNAKRNEKQRLADALALNEPLATAYYMKEELRTIWSQDNKKAAQTLLADWIARAEASSVVMLKKFAKTLRSCRLGILAWYDHQISTGPLESLNNKIRVLQRKAYGFRDWNFFKLRICALHKARMVLVG